MTTFNFSTNNQKQKEKTMKNRTLPQILKEDYKTVKIHREFHEWYDGAYSFDEVGGPFIFMSPSVVLLEMDPTAYDQEFANWLDQAEYVEYDDDYYRQEDVEEAEEMYREELTNYKEILTDMILDGTDYVGDVQILEEMFLIMVQDQNEHVQTIFHNFKKGA